MPVIRFYGAQTQAGAQSQANIDPEAFGAGIGRAAQQAGQQIAGVAESYLARADKARRRKEAFDADIVIRQMTADDQAYLNQAKQEGRWDGAPDRAIEDSNKRNETYRRNIQKRFSPEMQETILATRNLQVQGFVQQAIGFEAAGRQEYEVNSIKTIAETDLNAIQLNPATLPKAMEGVVSLIDNSSLPINKKEEMKVQVAGQYKAASLTGRIMQGETDSILAEMNEGLHLDLPPEVQNRILGQIYAEQKRAEDEAKQRELVQAQIDFDAQVQAASAGVLPSSEQVQNNIAVIENQGKDDPRVRADLIKGMAELDVAVLNQRLPSMSLQDVADVSQDLETQMRAATDPVKQVAIASKLDAFTKAAKERNDAIRQDPGGYVNQVFLRTSNLTMSEMALENIKIQRNVLGLSAGEIRPLPKAVATKIGEDFLPENASTAVESLRQLSATFGPAFPQVWNQIVTENKQIPRHFQYLDLLPDTVSQGILQNPTADKDATAGLNTKSITEKIRVNTTFISLQRSFNHHFDGGQSFMNGFIPLLQQAVTQQMLKQGATDATPSMVASVMQKISDDYAFGENHDDSTYLIPRGFDPKDVERNLDDYLENLKQEDVQTDIKLAREGIWVSNDANDGLELIDSLGDRVRDANGRIVEFSFENIIRLNEMRYIKNEKSSRELQNSQARDAAAAAAAAKTAQPPVAFESLGD